MPLSNYRNFLREELRTRKFRNPKYSLRAFARDLGLSPARLSDVIHGRYGLSREAALRIATRLGLPSEEAEYFGDLVEAEHARSRKKRAEARTRLQNRDGFSEITLDQFHLISDWYHFAILELLSLPGAHGTASIAREFGLTLAQARSALERLKRLGLITERQGKLVPREDFTATPDQTPSSAIRRFHSQLLAKSLSALQQQAVEERDFSNIMFSLDPRDLPAIKSEIKRFRRTLVRRFGSNAKEGRVYSLSIQLFSLHEAKPRG